MLWLWGVAPTIYKGFSSAAIPGERIQKKATVRCPHRSPAASQHEPQTLPRVVLLLAFLQNLKISLWLARGLCCRLIIFYGWTS